MIQSTALATPNPLLTNASCSHVLKQLASENSNEMK